MKSKYTQDVEFNSGFGALQTPVHLYTAASLCGFSAPPISHHFRYLDLACGNGLTLSLLADAYPFAEFVGIDINTAHIAGAKERARKAELTNLRFIEADIADLATDDFNPFDYCAIGGVYSWLDSGRRHKTRQFIEAVVRPGGLVYLDYSAQPGMAQTAPLYQILKQVGAAQPGDSAAKLSAATHLLDAMRQKGARFFDQNPRARDRLAGILDNPPQDEAHEVFNLQAFGLWSSEVIESLQRQGFSYVGNSGLHHNVAAFAAHQRLPGQCEDMPLPLQQMLQDVAWNVAQRKDIYIRNNGSSEKCDLLHALQGDAVYVAPGALTTANRRQVCKGFPGVDLSSAVADAVAESVKTASTFGQIFERLLSAGFSQSEVVGVITNLLAARLLSVAVKPTPEASVVGDLYMPSKLNQLILTEDISQEHARPFASPVAGSRLLLSIKDRLYLWAIVNGDVGNAWDAMDELRNAFRGDKGELLDRFGFIQVLNASSENFKKVAVPELLRLGILAAKKQPS